MKMTWNLDSNLTSVCCARVGISTTYFWLERGSLTRQSARSGQKGDADDNFRGVSFDGWLRLIMQVSHTISCGLYA